MAQRQFRNNIQSTLNSIWSQFISHLTCCVSTGITPNEVLFDGVPLWKSKTEIEWLLSEEDESRERRFNLLRQREMSASNTKSVITSFFSLKGEPISNLLADNLSNLEAEVWLENNSTKIKIDANIVEVEASSNDANTSHKLQIVFSGKQVGKYIVYLRSSNQIVRGFPTEGLVIPGNADPSKTCIVENRSSTLLIAADYSSHENIRVQVNDKYGNRIKTSESLEQIAVQLKLALWKRIDGENQREDMLLSENHSVVYRGSGIGGECLIISLSFAEGQEGWYSAQILLDGRKINIASNLTLIVICRRDYNKIDRLISNTDIFSGSSYFEGELVSIDQQLSDRNKKSKKVFIYMTGKQVIIKEYFLKFIPMRLYTFRLTPTTKVNLVYSPLHDLSEEITAVRNQYQSYCSTVIEIDDGCQSRPQLIINDKKLGDKRNGGTLFAACFHRKMLQRLGGSETFLDKQNIFNKNLVEYHSERGNRRNKLGIKIERWCVINSSYQATKWFSDSQWINLFEIEFEGEEGIDQGGLRREWFEILCRELFSPSYKLFVQAEDGSDAVLPNSNPYPEGLGKNALKMYKFAGKIVGKCLVESAHGTTYRQQLPIRLAKSFLAQIVGLRVQYKHFCNDTPEFFSTKIHSIVNGNVDDPESGMNEMIFAEEEYDQNTGKVDNIRTVDLKPGGTRIYVTENNKYEYLDLLAQYKLCNRIKDQTTAFLDGIHRMVPDSLLTLFDEDELELLLCGIREYSLSDLKKHHIVVGGIFSGPSIKILNWFWLALSSFTTEQMARLVQFTTGSSQLPQGGFASLQPKFQIMGSGEPNSLPTAHTCFNMICLPDHNQYSHFEQALLTAITEGNEGFGLV